MKPIETRVLAMALVGPVTFREVYTFLFYPPNPDRAYRLLNRLRRYGCIANARYGLWEITERGRIALALARCPPKRRRLAR